MTFQFLPALLLASCAAAQTSGPLSGQISSQTSSPLNARANTATSGINVLQPAAKIPGPAPANLGTGADFYVPVTPATITWGYLPTPATPILTVPSGAVVTFDTVSHEGLLEDQGRNPIRFFGRFGVPPAQVLSDAQAITDSPLQHDFATDGPHLVVGPVAVGAAQPGDVLKIEFLAFTPRVPYGVISNRHGKGALPGEFPEGPPPDPSASAADPDRFHNVSTFVPLSEVGGHLIGTLNLPDHRVVHFPAAPFLGTVGVTPATPPAGSRRTNAIPPGAFGGNLDIRYLTAGSTLYLPVQIPGAGLFVSDPHMSQGDGEVSLTAMEGSLRATLRLTVLHPGEKAYPFHRPLLAPFAETPDLWIVVGLDPDLNQATKNAVRAAIDYLAEEHGLDRATALAYLSAAADFDLSQVVDRVKGVHVLIRKQDFTTPPAP